MTNGATPGAALGGGADALIPELEDQTDPLQDAGACIEVVTGFDKVIPTVLLLIDRSLSMDDPLPGGGDPGGGAMSRWDTVRDILTNADTGLIMRLQTDVRFGLMLYTAEQEMGDGNMGGDNQFGQGGDQFGQGGLGQGFGGFQMLNVGTGGSTVPVATGGSSLGGTPGVAGAPVASGGSAGTTVVEDAGPACPLLVEVPISLDNYTAINDVYSMAEPGYTTPTADSVAIATDRLLAFSEMGPKTLILATDGEPGDCIYPVVLGNVGSDENRQNSVDAVAATLAAGIETAVISVGDDVGQDHLEELALAGSSDPNAAPYTSTNATELEQAFVEIIGNVQSCVFNLEGEVPAFHAPMGSVTVNGVELVYDDPNGWTMPDVSTVEVTGTACEQVQNGTGEVNISFPCVPANEVMR